MNERLKTLLFALAAGVLAFVLLTPSEIKQAEPASVPTTEDNGVDGLNGLISWLQQQDLGVVSFRKRFHDLNQNLPPRGNVLIMSMPVPKKILKSEWSALADWLDQGNTLILLAAVYSEPAWRNQQDCICDVKSFLSGYYAWDLHAEDDENEVDQDEAAKTQASEAKTLKSSIAAIKTRMAEQSPITVELVPQSVHPILADIEQVEAETTPYLLERAWTLESDDQDNLALGLLHASGRDMTSVWLMSAGAGQIVLTLTPDIFSNARLNHANNAQFFINLINQSLSEHGRLLFDDYHFGLSDLYDPERFFQDRRLHKTLAFLVLFWLFYVIGYSERLAPIRVRAKKISACDSVDVMAVFFARRLNKRLLGDELVKHLLEEIARSRRLRDEDEVWQWLERHSRIEKQQLELLKSARNHKKHSLRALTDTISTIRTFAL